MRGSAPYLLTVGAFTLKISVIWNACPLCWAPWPLVRKSKMWTRAYNVILWRGYLHLYWLWPHKAKCTMIINIRPASFCRWLLARQLLEDRLYYYIVRSWWINGDFFPPSEEPKMQSSQVITHVTMASYLPISRQHASPILSWNTLLTSPLSIGSSKTRMKYPDFSLESADCKCSSTSIIQVLQVQFPIRRHCQWSVLQLQSWFQNRTLTWTPPIWYLDSRG